MATVWQRLLNEKWEALKVVSLLVVLGLGIWIRLYHLGQQSLWHDEAFTWWITSMPQENFLKVILLDGVNPPFYYIVERFSIKILGNSEFGLRFLSVFSDFVSLIFVIMIGKEVGTRKGIFPSTLFWAFHPMTIWYAREARPYAFVLMLASGSVYFYLLSKRKNSFPIYIGALTFLALGLITHYFFFLIWGILILLTKVRNGAFERCFRKRHKFC
jgi:mannosyltransferase